MQVIGLIGGMSWESTLVYYRLINEAVREKLGGFHSARILMYSLDFHEIETLQRLDQWEEAAAVLEDAAGRLARGGADLILICTNTMHKVADQVRAAAKIPLLHIADALGEQVTGMGLTRVGLLGTRFTMEQDFFKVRLRQAHGLDVLVPEAGSRRIVHDIIYDELCQGQVTEASKQALLGIIRDLEAHGAEGVVLGCTELPLLVGQADASVPIFDTTAIHARKAVEIALGE